MFVFPMWVWTGMRSLMVCQTRAVANGGRAARKGRAERHLSLRQLLYHLLPLKLGLPVVLWLQPLELLFQPGSGVGIFVPERLPVQFLQRERRRA